MMALFRPISAWFDRVKAGPLDAQPEVAKALGACGLIILALVLIAGAAILARVHVGHWPPPRVYVVEGNTAKQVQVLNTPALSQVKIRRWTTRTLREVFSFNFVNYNDHLNNISDNFTDLGWASFQKALAGSKIEDRIMRDRLDVFLVPISVAHVDKTERYADAVVFKLQMRALMVYRGATKSQSKPVLVDAIVRQVPTNENPDGVAISSLAIH